MKMTKLFLTMSTVAILFTSCYTETILVQDTIVDPQPLVVSLDDVLSEYELWYVDVNQSNANGEILFMQIAFTVSFENGIVYANNNLVGIGDQGYGLGIDIGYYNTNGFDLNITHDLDGFNSFKITQLSQHTLELFNSATGVFYTLIGAQRDSFDYNALFYDNIHYFVQEYGTWEKTFTSQQGAINEFDNENFVAFLPGGGTGNFLSSQDQNGTNPNNIYYDYTGIYNIDDVSGNRYLKFVTLDYDFLGNEYFEMSVLNDELISLYHPNSGTTYEFTGRGYIQLKNQEIALKGTERGKMRLSKQQIEKQRVEIGTI